MKMTVKRRNALKRILKCGKGTCFEYPFLQDGKQWFVSFAHLVVLNEAIEWEMREDFSYPDMARLVLKSNVPVDLPNIDYLKDLKSTEKVCFVGSHWIDVRLLLDVLEALPGARAFVNKTGSIYLESEDGFGFVLPCRIKR